MPFNPHARQLPPTHHHHQLDLVTVVSAQLAKNFSMWPSHSAFNLWTYNQPNFFPHLPSTQRTHYAKFSLWTCHGSQPRWKIPVVVTRFSCHSSAVHFVCR